jgi:3-oxoadipate enol-lactonase
MPVELHHTVDGPAEGPVLLLGSSLGATGAMWEPQVAALAARWRVVRFDHRGHGGSPVPAGPYSLADLGGDVLALVDSLGAERISYAGLSLGGMVGQWLAIHVPHRLDRAILMCTSAHIPDNGYAQRAATVRRAGSPAVVADSVVERWFTSGWAREHPDVVARHRAMIASIPAEGYAGCAEAIAALDLRGQLAGISAPTLVLGARQDRALPPEHSEQIAAAIPRARLEILDPGAHLANVERAEEVTRLMLEHLDHPSKAMS